MVVIRLIGGSGPDVWVPSDKKVAAIKSVSDPIHTHEKKIREKLRVKVFEGHRLYPVADKAASGKWKGPPAPLYVLPEMHPDHSLSDHNIESAGDFIVVIGPGPAPPWLKIEGSEPPPPAASTTQHMPQPRPTRHIPPPPPSQRHVEVPPVPQMQPAVQKMPVQQVQQVQPPVPQMQPPVHVVQQAQPLVAQQVQPSVQQIPPIQPQVQQPQQWQPQEQQVQQPAASRIPPILNEAAVLAAQAEVLQMRNLLEDMSVKLEAAKQQGELLEAARGKTRGLKEELVAKREECVAMKERHEAEVELHVREKEMLREEAAKLRLVNNAKGREIAALKGDLAALAAPRVVPDPYTTYQYIKAYELTSPLETLGRSDIIRGEAEEWRSINALATPLRWSYDSTMAYTRGF